jgi:hypothetical protein
MDPYLEGELWQAFHETLASAIRAQLMPRLGPKYVALLAKRYVLDRPALAPPESGAEDAEWVTATLREAGLRAGEGVILSGCRPAPP